MQAAKGTPRKTQAIAFIINMVERMIGAALAQDLFRGKAAKPLGPLVPIKNPTLAIDEINPVIERIQDSRIKGLVQIFQHIWHEFVLINFQS